MTPRLTGAEASLTGKGKCSRLLLKKAADINGDGVVTIDDATFLQTYLAEFGTTFPIGEVA